MDYITDEELIERYRSGESSCLDELMSRYLSYIRAKARSYFLIGGEREDLVQEGMIGLFKAVRDFQPEKNSLFKTFAEVCVSRQIATALKLSNRYKHLPLNSYVSFYQTYSGDIEVKDILEGNELSPEQILIDKESAHSLAVRIKEKLSVLEKKVLYKYIQGLSYRQIAKELLISEKTIDNALQRIKKKLLTDKTN
jgi:RNA polymerase sporulation-specific sigma factor